jgi:hypothetical protein
VGEECLITAGLRFATAGIGRYASKISSNATAAGASWISLVMANRIRDLGFQQHLSEKLL